MFQSRVIQTTGKQRIGDTNTSELAQLQIICFWKIHSLALFQDFLISHSFSVIPSCGTKVNVTCLSFAGPWASHKGEGIVLEGVRWVRWEDTSANLQTVTPVWTWGTLRMTLCSNFPPLFLHMLKFSCSAQPLFLSRGDNQHKRACWGKDFEPGRPGNPITHWTMHFKACLACFWAHLDSNTVTPAKSAFIPTGLLDSSSLACHFLKGALSFKWGTEYAKDPQDTYWNVSAPQCFLEGKTSPVKMSPHLIGL